MNERASSANRNGGAAREAGRRSHLGGVGEIVRADALYRVHPDGGLDLRVNARRRMEGGCAAMGEAKVTRHKKKKRNVRE